VVPVGKKARVVLKKAGTFDYFCKFHPNMVGKIVAAKRPK
jgi:plastocyanin